MRTLFLSLFQKNFIKKSKRVATKKHSINLLSCLSKAGNLFFIFLIQSYRLLLSPFMGGSCRFTPTCSCYAEEVFKSQPFFIAIKLTLIRISKCHPWGPFGLDPAPKGK